MSTVFQSLLFVPGSRPERFAKALASGADCVCIDLEDAVPPEGKDEARKAALDAAAAEHAFAVRINSIRTAFGIADLHALAGAAVRPAMLLLPMVEEAAEVAIVRQVLGEGVALVPLIETVTGLGNARAIAADPAVVAVMFGGADFSAELGVALCWEATAHARAQLVMACAAERKLAVDVPHIALDDAAGLADECAKARALGFGAKAAIHPAQIAPIHGAFRPSAEEIAEAEEAQAAFAAAGGAAVRFKGKMLEAPVMARYRKLLALKEKIDA